MTREEEKNKARFEYVSKRLANPDFPTYNAEYELEAAFDEGAKWADEHPKQIEISLEDIEELAKEVIPDDWVKRQDTLWEMIRRNQRAQFIDKACEWLDDYLTFSVAEWDEGVTTQRVIDKFRKAMGGEKR